ncbi:MAG TPA: hypothetical protein VM238_22855 [Phycisphaerae bacterium]|nr:hypothetical protein [Phycisphaerae bacterium]
MTALLSKIAIWLFVRYIEWQAEKGLTYENAKEVRTRIIHTLTARFEKAIAKTPDFKADDRVWQFGAWVMDGDPAYHRLQSRADDARRLLGPGR